MAKAEPRTKASANFSPVLGCERGVLELLLFVFSFIVAVCLLFFCLGMADMSLKHPGRGLAGFSPGQMPQITTRTYQNMLLLNQWLK